VNVMHSSLAMYEKPCTSVSPDPQGLYKCFIIIMAALCNRAGHYILHCDFFLLLLSIFFPRLISAAADWISTILPHMVWP